MIINITIYINSLQFLNDISYSAEIVIINELTLHYLNDSILLLGKISKSPIDKISLTIFFQAK